MKTKNTKQNTNLNKIDKKEYQKKTGYARPVYFKDEKGNLTVERFGSNDDARNEARTVAIRIIKHCRRKSINIQQFIRNGLVADMNTAKGDEYRIMQKTPPETLKKALRSLRQFEERTSKRVTAVLSIRPLIDKDKRGHFVKGLELIDDPSKINRKYPENKFADAF